ncbi:MAG: hypothetical protein M1482_01330 [Chloroflexi bacterium]|nr:hypothetical protein [Chloroflexota bacterium]
MADGANTASFIDAPFQIGDRIGLNADANALRQGLLPLDPVLAGAISQAEVVIDADEPTTLKFSSAEGTFRSVRHLPARQTSGDAHPRMCQCIARAFSPDRTSSCADSNLPASSQGIAFSAEDIALLEGRGTFARWRDFRLALQATRFAMVAGFDQLLCLPWLRDVELLEYQLRTARMVLRRLRGGALLCDEVGLGKTCDRDILQMIRQTKLRGPNDDLMVEGSLFGLRSIGHAIAHRAGSGSLRKTYRLRWKFTPHFP